MVGLGEDGTVVLSAGVVEFSVLFVTGATVVEGGSMIQT